MKDITSNAPWITVCEHPTIDFPVLTANAEVLPDHCGRATFFAEGFTLHDERGIVGQYGYDPILKSKLFICKSDEEVKEKLRKWINDHTVEAMQIMIKRISDD